MNDSLLGHQVAGYRIERLLGRGGMASVYFAWDTKNDRAVALKVMDERYRELPSYVDRFIHEAQTIAAWDQPNIVHVYDAGEEGGIYYYALEFIRGLDLSLLLKQYMDARQLMPYNEVVRIGWAVANALDYAHAHGIIHRDVKPSNVLISIDGRVLLSDFGLVMDINRGTVGETFGSPAYIAPEQARSSAGAVPQSDNYALGVMLYEMLTGQVPFYDQSPTALALKHITQEPPLPRALNPRLNPAVEAVLMRALRKQPADRYATGREMLSALQRALDNELRSPDANAPQPTGPQTVAVLPGQAGHRPPAWANPSSDVTAVGPSALPKTEVRAQPYPSQPAATQARDYAQTQDPAFSRNSPGTGSSHLPPPVLPGATANGGGLPPAYPPTRARRGRSWGWGCLGALLAVVLLAIFVGAALSAFRPDRYLPPEIAQLWQVLLPGLKGQPAAAVSPEPSPTATLTTEPSQKPDLPTSAATATSAAPTATRTPTLAVTPTPSVTPNPSLTPAPSATTQVMTNLILARNKQTGFILLNTGPDDLQLADLEIYDTTNHLLVPGTAWDLDAIRPGECVSVWAQDAKFGLPPGVRCTVVGKQLVVARSQIFWSLPMEVHFNGQRVATCEAKDNRCTFNTLPQ